MNDIGATPLCFLKPKVGFSSTLEEGRSIVASHTHSGASAQNVFFNYVFYTNKLLLKMLSIISMSFQLFTLCLLREVQHL